MDVLEYTEFDGVGLADLIATRQVSAEDVQLAARKVVEQRNPAINAVIELFDKPLDSKQGPLTGVPFFFKDMGGVAKGRLHELGSRLAKGLRSEANSRLTERYLEAGLAILGRATSPEMAFNITAESLATGITRNPWNLEHSTGGSSGGSAAAVASGMAPIAQANDGGGSIRIPAACCGLVGLKPTRGRISEAPFAGHYLSGLSASNVVTRTVRDTALMLDLTHGTEPGDLYYLPAVDTPFSDLIKRPARQLKIALQLDAWGGAPVDASCTSAARGTEKLLSGMGHIVEEVAFDPGVDWEDIITANAKIWCANIALSIREIAAHMERPIDNRHLENVTLACYNYGIALKASDLLEALSLVNTVTRHSAQLFKNYDVMLTPTLPNANWPLGKYDSNDARYDAIGWTRTLFNAVPFTPLFNMTGQPAISIPWDQGDGGPGIGVQFVGRMAAEGDLLQIAADIERAHPWNKVAPWPPSTGASA